MGGRGTERLTYGTRATGVTRGELMSKDYNRRHKENKRIARAFKAIVKAARAAGVEIIEPTALPTLEREARAHVKLRGNTNVKWRKLRVIAVLAEMYGVPLPVVHSTLRQAIAHDVGSDTELGKLILKFPTPQGTTPLKSEFRKVQPPLDNDYDKIAAFYQSYEWRRLRYFVLKNYGRKCMLCGTTEGAMHGDHIKPLRKYWELRLDPENIQILCEVCNHGKGNWDETDWRPK